MIVVDYTEHTHAKHTMMQRILADMRKKAEVSTALPDAPVGDGDENTKPITLTTYASSEVGIAAPPAIRLAVGEDAMAIEVLDRKYPQIRATFVRLCPGSIGYIPIAPLDKPCVVPKAWSFRVRDSDDPRLRRTAVIKEVTTNGVMQPGFGSRCAIETDEFEADYYRMALESGKEATLVARDISSFDQILRITPLMVVFYNPSNLHNIDILVRLWGEQGIEPSCAP